jgi:hypothetical protein
VGFPCGILHSVGAACVPFNLPHDGPSTRSPSVWRPFPSLSTLPHRLAELAEPYYVFKGAGYDVTLASPKGGAVPIDAASLQGDFNTPEAQRFAKDGGWGDGSG